MLRLVLALACSLQAASLQLPATTTRRAVLASLPLVIAAPRTAVADEVLHIIDYPQKGACGEALVPDAGVPFVKAFGGFSDGTCAAAGYPNKEGTASGTGDKDKDREYTIYSK